eukprot:8745-Alexandrium_andersonii.AAC.1
MPPRRLRRAPAWPLGSASLAPGCPLVGLGSGRARVAPASLAASGRSMDPQHGALPPSSP